MLKIIAGRAKSGKSGLAVSQFTDYICSEFKTDSAYYIVPEQYTVEVERRILNTEKMKDKALFGDEVLSFKRLVHRLLGLYGGASGDVLSESGRIMLLSKVAYNLKSKLSYFKDIDSNPDRAQQVLMQIEEFGKNLVDPDKLEKINSSSSSESLKLKLSDLCLIYKQYNEEIAKIGSTEESLYTEACEKAEKNGFFTGKRVWIDEFTGFTPIERMLVECMIKSCDDVTVCLCFDKEKDPIFDCIRNTCDILCKICDECHVKYSIEYTEDAGYRQDLLNVLERRFTAVKHEEKLDLPKDVISQNLEIHKSDNIFSEIQYAACKVKELYNSGIDYSDITLATRAIDDYGPATEAVFSLEGIPFFRDSRKNVLSNPIISAVTSALAVISDNFRKEDIIVFLKTGLYILDRDMVDSTENYIISNRLSGLRRWKSEKEPICSKLFESFSSLSSDIHDTNNISGTVSALIKFLTQCGIEKNVRTVIADLTKANRREEAEEYRLVWDGMAEILHQADAFLGEWQSDSFSARIKMFSELFSSASARLSVGFLPQKQHAVRLYDISRSCMGSAKALIILGANEGIMPATVSDDGILSDSDRSIIKSHEVELADDTDTVIEKEMFRIYSAISMPSDYLMISYPLYDGSGEQMMASGSVVNKITGMFTNLTHTLDSSNDIDTNELNEDAHILPEHAEKMFLNGDEPLMSVSQIETYNDCPYSYFIKYGLGAKPRDDGEWNDIVLGNIMHSLIEKGLKKVEESDFTGKNNSEIKRACIKTADEILSDCLLSLPGGYVDDEKRSVLMSRLSRFAGNCIFSIYSQFSNDGFRPKAYELKFGPDSQVPPVCIDITESDGTKRKTIRFSGKIDRFDALIDKDNGKIYVRVIDYKSSKHTVNIDEIKAGIKLQLAVYLEALTKDKTRKQITASISGEDKYEVIPGGAFYYTMGDDITSAENRQRAANVVISDDSPQFDKMHGIFIYDSRMFEASKKDSSFGKGKNEPDNKLMFNSSETDSLYESIENNILKSTGRILAGNIPSNALVKNDNTTPCTYCKFASICGRNGNKDGKL